MNIERTAKVKLMKENLSKTRLTEVKQVQW